MNEMMIVLTIINTATGLINYFLLVNMSRRN